LALHHRNKNPAQIGSRRDGEWILGGGQPVIPCVHHESWLLPGELCRDIAAPFWSSAELLQHHSGAALSYCSAILGLRRDVAAPFGAARSFPRAVLQRYCSVIGGQPIHTELTRASKITSSVLGSHPCEQIISLGVHGEPSEPA
jgi:hypothetical protein